MSPIIDKILSGKFIITILAGLVFVFMSVRGMLPADKVNEILLIVIYAYFTKAQTPKG